jgi:hypothetical protein
VGTDTPPGQAEPSPAEAAAVPAPAAGSAGDPLPEAFGLAQGAAAAGLGLKLLGGLAVRVICPDFPPRLRAGQDMDFACLSKGRKAVAAFLEQSGCVPDRRFNNLNGDRQMYFNAPSGRPIDVMVDRLTMCHTLDFRPSFSQLPFTLDVVDVLLTKLQIVELNEKDARDLLQLLAAVPLAGDPGQPSARPAPAAASPARPAVADPASAADPAGAAAALAAAASQPGQVIDTSRFGKLLGADWGWWRTVTGNLEKLPALAAERPELLPPAPPLDPVQACHQLLDVAQAAPKSVKWKLRANVGDRVRWYEQPEEVGH